MSNEKYILIDGIKVDANNPFIVELDSGRI